MQSELLTLTGVSLAYQTVAGETVAIRDLN